MKNVDATVASLLVAKQIPRPLYLVVDDARIKDAWDIEVAALNKTAHLTDFHLFVERDLKKALEPYFVEVHVVHSKEELPQSHYIVGDVKVDRVRINPQQEGILMHILVEMTWSFALRPDESENYVFSYAGTGDSTGSYPNFETGVAQMVEASITGMLHVWTEDNGIEKLRSIDGKGGAAPGGPPASTPKPKGDGLRRL